MIIEEIIRRVPILESIGTMDLEIAGLCFDSRKVTSHSAYVAVAGTLSDGHSYIQQAIENGAKLIVCENLPEKLLPNISYIKVKNSAIALGQMASNYFGNPSEQLSLVGITGTNGKTSVATLLYDVFQQLGFSCVLISTVEYRIGNQVFPSTHTTPDVLRINEILVSNLPITRCNVERACSTSSDSIPNSQAMA
jgi:UDP-N-acetylmuramoyl-L-alanyl-D-glutamate--2,6-diaminopimelate ligase